jgi:hypothetical protein
MKACSLDFRGVHGHVLRYVLRFMKRAHHSSLAIALSTLLVGGCTGTEPNQARPSSLSSIVGTISPGDDGTILISLPNGETRQEFVEHYNLYEELAKHQGRMMRLSMEYKMTPMPPDDRLEQMWVVTGYQLL